MDITVLDITILDRTDVTILDEMDITILDRMDITILDRTDTTTLDRMDITILDRTDTTTLDRMDITKLDRTGTTTLDRMDITKLDRTDTTTLDRMDITVLDRTDTTTLDTSADLWWAGSVRGAVEQGASERRWGSPGGGPCRGVGPPPLVPAPPWRGLHTQQHTSADLHAQFHSPWEHEQTTNIVRVLSHHFCGFFFIHVARLVQHGGRVGGEGGTFSVAVNNGMAASAWDLQSVQRC